MKRLTISGNVTRDAELRHDHTGKPFVSFSVAINVGTKEQPKTDFVDVSCNGRLVELAQDSIHKGMKILIDGYPKVKAYLNQNNMPIAKLRLFAHTLEFLSRSENNIGYEKILHSTPDKIDAVIFPSQAD